MNTSTDSAILLVYFTSPPSHCRTLPHTLTCTSTASISFSFAIQTPDTYHTPSMYFHKLHVVLSFCNYFFTCHLVVFTIERRQKTSVFIIIIIIRQPLCPLVGRRPQHAVSKLPCLVLSSAISCRSSICPGRLSIAWLVSLVVFSCHMVSNW